jgi:acyl-CoA thioester hydrolase
MPAETQIEVRVRYAECDPMNVAHHSAYPVWLEIARTELLRQGGVAYRSLEEAGIFFVVARLSISFHKPAFYDDVLSVHVRTTQVSRVKVEHAYEVRRGGQRIATAATTLACVDRDGRVQPIPDGVVR